ncbi:MAG TPA: protein kinase family protein [Mycobacteriales bacterium]|nr:protein kinase family protein [Mycobacteriales bacterium]
MSVDTATPTGSAASVGDRYRLIECVAGDPDGPAAAWRAWDNLLNRPVTLTIVRPGGPAAGGFLGHAHAVSTVVHPALARVYDAVDEGDRAYVVSEWVSGTPLTALLNDGALDAESAAGTVARVADGVAAAHAAGVAFGGVHPDHVVVTADGGVKLAQVVGDGRAGTGDDLRGLGALLYGALTAHWPLAATGGAAALRPATTSSGHLLSPRQVRAGVPEDLSTLAVRALDQGSPQGLRSAAAMAAVLTERAGPAEDDFAFPPDDRGKRRRPRWLGVAIPVVAGLSALAMIGWLVGTALGGLPGADGGGNSAEASTPTVSATATAAALTVAKPAAAELHDPGGDGQEARDVELSWDGEPDTSWPTDRYKRKPVFGGLKTGMGIAYDFGEPVTLKQATIVTDRPGATVEIRAGDSAGATTVVGPSTALAPTSTIPIKASTPSRYYIVWMTALTPDGGGQYRGSLSEVTFRR